MTAPVPDPDELERAEAWLIAAELGERIRARPADAAWMLRPLLRLVTALAVPGIGLRTALDVARSTLELPDEP